MKLDKNLNEMFMGSRVRIAEGQHSGAEATVHAWGINDEVIVQMEVEGIGTFNHSYIADELIVIPKRHMYGETQASEDRAEAIQSRNKLIEAFSPISDMAIAMIPYPYNKHLAEIADKIAPMNPAYAYLNIDGKIWEFNYIVTQTEEEGPEKLMYRELKVQGPNEGWAEWHENWPIPRKIEEFFFGPLLK